MKCKDNRGNVLNNVERVGSSNALIFRKTEKFDEYVKEKRSEEKIKSLEEKVAELTALVNKLIK